MPNRLFGPARGATFLWIDELFRGLMFDHIVGVIGSLADSRAKFFARRRSNPAVAPHQARNGYRFCGADLPRRANPHPQWQRRARSLDV